MYCPNCGTDCGEFKFCPECGTKLIPQPTQTERPVQQGEPGAHIAPEDIPEGKYRGIKGCLELNKNGIVIWNTVLFKNYVTRIPYDQITAMRYVRSKGAAGCYLVFRWEENKHLPMPVGNARSTDPTTVSIFTKDKNTYYLLYHLIKNLAPTWAQCDMEIMPTPIAHLTDVIRGLDMDSYFNRFNPNRDDAIEALRKDTGMKHKDAKALIDRLFDARQMELYASDPAAVLRDLKFTLYGITPEKLAREKKGKELDAAGILYCPECFSTNVKSERRGFSLSQAWLGHTVVPIAGALAGEIGADDLMCVCLKCGHKWNETRRKK